MATCGVNAGGGLGLGFAPVPGAGLTSIGGGNGAACCWVAGGRGGAAAFGCFGARRLSRPSGGTILGGSTGATRKPTDGAHPSKRKDSGFEPEMVKLLHGYAVEAVKIPLSDRWQAPPATSARC